VEEEVNDKPVSQIMEHLWIGSVPPPGDYSAMDLVVLAAEEYPRDEVGQLSGPQILEVGLPDDKLDDKQKKLALEAAVVVAKFLSAGKKVLSTCAMGINRSSLIAALALVLMGSKPDATIELIRAKRNPSALCNPYFVELIYQTYVDILDKEIEGLIDAINKMIESRSAAPRSRTG
jgi:protein-tyrosine phosphatase